MSILNVVELKKYYGSGDTLVTALDGVSLDIEKGEFVTIVGTSGSGKSTLLNLAGALDSPTDGIIFIRGNDISVMPDDELTIFRRRNIGFVFQNYNLISMLNVYENIVLPILLDNDKVDKDYINKIITSLSLQEKLYSMPNQLSGGQQQRVAIARALATKPAIILADEPTGNLDSKTSIDIIHLLKNTANKFNQTVIMITHNYDLASYSNRIIRIEDGKIID